MRTAQGVIERRAATLHGENVPLPGGQNVFVVREGSKRIDGEAAPYPQKGYLGEHSSIELTTNSRASLNHRGCPDVKIARTMHGHVCKPIRAAQVLWSLPEVGLSRETKHSTDKRIVHTATYRFSRALRPSKSPSGAVLSWLSDTDLCVSRGHTTSRGETAS